jgi:hypothetical protein
MPVQRPPSSPPARTSVPAGVSARRSRASGARVLGERTLADAEHLFADREPGGIGAGRHDRAGHVQAGHGVLGGAQARDQADHVRLARHQVPGAPVEPGGMDPEEDLAASGRWAADLLQMPDVGGTVSGLHDRPHRLPSRYRRGSAAGIAGRRGLAGYACCCLHDRPLRRFRGQGGVASSATRCAGARL